MRGLSDPEHWKGARGFRWRRGPALPVVQQADMRALHRPRPPRARRPAPRPRPCPPVGRRWRCTGGRAVCPARKQRWREGGPALLRQGRAAFAATGAPQRVARQEAAGVGNRGVRAPEEAAGVGNRGVRAPEEAAWQSPLGIGDGNASPRRPGPTSGEIAERPNRGMTGPGRLDRMARWHAARAFPSFCPRTTGAALAPSPLRPAARQLLRRPMQPARSAAPPPRPQLFAPDGGRRVAH